MFPPGANFRKNFSISTYFKKIDAAELDKINKPKANLNLLTNYINATPELKIE